MDYLNQGSLMSLIVIIAGLGAILFIIGIVEDRREGKQTLPRSSLLALGSVLTLVLVLLGFWAWWNHTHPPAASQQRADHAALVAAQERWAKRSFTDYRLVLERRILDVTCTQEIDVAAERVVKVLYSNCPEPTGASDIFSPSTYLLGCRPQGQPSRPCPPPPMTVTELFQTIAAYVQTRHCGVNGCACDGWRIYRVAYDVQLGYPLHMEPTMRLKHPSPRGPCTVMGELGWDPIITVRQLVPEPVP
jgi:hypothetical protein